MSRRVKVSTVMALVAAFWLLLLALGLFINALAAGVWL